MRTLVLDVKLTGSLSKGFIYKSLHAIALTSYVTNVSIYRSLHAIIASTSYVINVGIYWSLHAIIASTSYVTNVWIYKSLHAIAPESYVTNVRLVIDILGPVLNEIAVFESIIADFFNVIATIKEHVYKLGT